MKANAMRLVTTFAAMLGSTELPAQNVFNNSIEIVGAKGTTPQIRLTQAEQGTWTLAEPAGTNSLAISQGGGLGIEYLRIQGGAPFAGYVGIGTSTPQQKLEVNGNIRAQGLQLWGGGQLQVQWCNVDDPADQKLSEFIQQNGVFAGRFVNDAYTQAAHWVEVRRNSGTHTVASVAFPAGSVGVGTLAPKRKLHLYEPNGFCEALWEEGAASASSIGRIWRWGTNPSGGFAAQAMNGDLTAGATVISLSPDGLVSFPGNIGIGIADPGQHKLAVNGTGKFKEVIVETTGWSDYVFAADYELAPLSEVEAHIKEYQHLPGIPSAKEVAEHGVSVGEMQAKLLAKIEELTLHVIAQQKQIAAQEARILSQGEQIALLSGKNGSTSD